MKTKQELLDKFKLRREEFIGTLPSREEDQIGYTPEYEESRMLTRMDQLDRYAKLQRAKKLPVELRVLENILYSERARLRPNCRKDPVYNFLREAKRRLTELFSEYYESEVAPYRYPEGDREKLSEAEREIREYDNETDWEMRINTKEDFLSNFMHLFEQRGWNRNHSSDDWEQDVRIDDKKYQFLLGFADSQGEVREQKLKEFIAIVPNYAWERFPSY